MNVKSERDMKTKNSNPNKRVLKGYGYGFLVDTLCIFFLSGRIWFQVFEFIKKLVMKWGQVPTF